jgi:hypothetical protein
LLDEVEEDGVAVCVALGESKEEILGLLERRMRRQRDRKCASHPMSAGVQEQNRRLSSP